MNNLSPQMTAPRVLPRTRKFAPLRDGHKELDPKDPLQSVREYRLHRVATKRIPSRMT